MLSGVRGRRRTAMRRRRDRISDNRGRGQRRMGAQSCRGQWRVNLDKREQTRPRSKEEAQAEILDLDSPVSRRLGGGTGTGKSASWEVVGGRMRDCRGDADPEYGSWAARESHDGELKGFRGMAASTGGCKPTRALYQPQTRPSGQMKPWMKSAHGRDCWSGHEAMASGRGRCPGPNRHVSGDEEALRERERPNWRQCRLPQQT